MPFPYPLERRVCEGSKRQDIMIRQSHKLEALRYVSSLLIQKKDNTTEKRIAEYSKNYV